MASSHNNGKARDGYRRGRPVAGGLRGGTLFFNPQARFNAIARQLSDALDPVKAPGKIRSFADMSAAERGALRRLYESPS